MVLNCRGLLFEAPMNFARNPMQQNYARPEPGLVGTSLIRFFA